MDRFLQDIRYALRQLAKSPAFTVTAVLTLALGIGANTAIYSLLDQVMLRSLPVKEPNRLVMVTHTGSDRGRVNAYGGSQADYYSYPMYRDIRDKNTVFSGVLATDQAQVGVQWHNQPELVSGELVSGNYFDVLGVKPALGRLLVQSDDDVQERNPVVVLSYAYWQRRFGSDPRVVNDTILINSHPFTVVGIAPPGFKSFVLGQTPGVFAPMMMKPQITPGWNDLDNRRSIWLNVIARLKPGISIEQAQTALQPLWHSLREDELNAMTNVTAKTRDSFLNKSQIGLEPAARGFSPVREQIGTPLIIVMAMVGLVVLIACANVASLLLVRAAGRVREMSIRYALGASRVRVVQQLLSEGLLLGIGGGGLGLVIAPQISQLLLNKIFTDSSGQIPFSSGLDSRVLLFNFSVSVAVGLLFSLAPALQFWRPNLVNTLKQQLVTSSGGQLRLRRGSVALQMGLSLLLLFGAGLFVRTLHNLKTAEVGFATDHLVTFGIEPGYAGYQLEQNPQLFRHVVETLSSMPGVQAAAGTDDPELTGNNEQSSIGVPGYIPAEDEKMQSEWAYVTPGYFQTLKRPFLAGRDFSDQDSSASTKVAIVNEKFARHFFGDAQHAIGRNFARGSTPTDQPDIHIVGVVADAKHRDLRDKGDLAAYIPYTQQDPKRGLTFMQFYVRTLQPPDNAVNTVRAAMQNLDSKLALDSLRTMDVQIQDDVNSESTITFLAVSFGVLAMLLAAVGLYGVLAFSTAQRTREIGIRMALGASRRSVIELVLREVVWLAGISVAVALPTALLLARYLRTQLYGVSSTDPITMTGVVIVIAAVAALAAMLPARRAAGVNPTRALRYE
ncbi:MAG: ABC transporter permease [Acidobacteria bacterium]|nr:ABC transporter permease [Acidobacteriota bacterium]MBV9148064.1 ABC transporter permease [Acidobacteriota bacterium]MBV9437303.1 ABC transporter permease [Acidobacteriota bacterium]